MTAQCPCGSKIDYSHCCGLYLDADLMPSTPEKLMRSRYSAYVLANIDYIKKTMRGKALAGFDESNTQSWAESVKWLGLEIISTRNESPNCGFVEFIARFLEGGKQRAIHENSEFHRIDERWYYVNGTHLKNPSVKIGRNSFCPCGSNKKFKNCHGKD